MKILTYGKSPRSGSRNVWTRIKNVDGARHLSKFGIFSARFKLFPVAIGDHGRNLVISLWCGGDKATINGVVAWRLIPTQKSPCTKIRCESSSLNFLRSRLHSPRQLSSKGPNYQRGVLLIFTAAIEGHFEGKAPREFHQFGLVLARQCPGSLVTSNQEQTSLPVLPISWSPTLFSGCGPVGQPPVPWTEKNWNVAIFFRRGGHCCRLDLVGRKIFWFFWAACKS